jgi:hypothetical protein
MPNAARIIVVVSMPNSVRIQSSSHRLSTVSSTIDHWNRTLARELAFSRPSSVTHLRRRTRVQSTAVGYSSILYKCSLL